MWTKATESKAVSLFNAGQTAAQIASKIGRSRSAVLGKLYRLGVLGKASKDHGKRISEGKKARGISIQEYLSLPATWPVVEKLKHTIVLMPSKQDIKTATKKDPRACALHNAACRTFNVPNCAIGGRWAYIPQRDEKGKPYIARMQATTATQEAIRTFDETGEMPEGGFTFRPIAKSHRYKTKNAYNKTWRQKPETEGSRPRKHAKARRVFRSMPRNLLGA